MRAFAECLLGGLWNVSSVFKECLQSDSSAAKDC